MKKIFYLLAAFCLVFQANAQYDPDALAVLNSMSAKYKSIDAFTANFGQQLINKSADLNEKIEGEITVKDDMYVLKIADQQIYNNGKDVFAYNPEINEVTIDKYFAETQEISLGNIWTLYQNGFKYALMSSNRAGDRTVELDPETDDKSYYKIRMVITKDNDLKKFTVFERSGNQYVYTIKEFTQNPDIKNSYFTFNPKKYPGIEIIDFR